MNQAMSVMIMFEPKYMNDTYITPFDKERYLFNNNLNFNGKWLGV
jgi:hypothetical protein